MTITNQQLQEWERAAEAATPGPWEPIQYHMRVATSKMDEQFEWANDLIVAEINQRIHRDGQTQEDNDAQVAERKANADFIALSRTAFPSLIQEYRDLKATVEAFEERTKLKVQS